MLTFENRLNALMKGWEPDLKNDMEAYLLSSGCLFLRDRQSGRIIPPAFWMRIPFWIIRKWKTVNPSGKIFFSDDFMWGQFCVYLATKIKDDVFDGQTGILSSNIIAGILFRESASVWKKYFGKESAFPKYYDGYLDITFNSITEIESLQKNYSSSLVGFDKEYRKVSSVLKISTLALFIANKKFGDYRDVETYMDLMSAGIQLWDDYMDIEEDLKEGKVNYAARLLPVDILPGTDVRILQVKIYEALLATDAYKKVFNKIADYFVRAHETIKDLDMPRENLYHSETMRLLEEKMKRIHRERVESVFGGLL